MKNLSELRNNKLSTTSSELVFSRIRNLNNRILDFDVYLESKGVNLQRGNVWNLSQKQELILSILLERYIPYICIVSAINENGKEDILKIIDGKQRLTAMIEFYNNIFPIILEGNSMFFDDLPVDYQKAIAFYDIRAKMAYDQYDKKITDDEIINWFLLINFAGTPQDKAHFEKLSALL